MTQNDAFVSMTPADAREIALDLLFREAHALDTQRWQDWLMLYAPDARFWLPAWIDEHRVTEDPQTQVSLMYLDSRRGLEERVKRLGSRKSVTAMPLPRTMHLFGNVQLLAATADGIRLRANGTVTSHDPRRGTSTVLAIRYDYALRSEAGAWLIAAKTAILLEDRLPGVVDFYSV